MSPVGGVRGGVWREEKLRFGTDFSVQKSPASGG